MAVDRVLVEIVTAANMTGVKEAQAGFLGMSTALTAMTAGIGLAAVAGKSFIDIAEKQEAAQNSLTQAVQQYNDQYGKTTTTGAIATATLTKLTDAQAQAHDSLTIAQNSATKAQLAYTDAVKKHGKHSEQAYKAALNLQDANIRLKNAQDALTDSTKSLNDAQAMTGNTVSHGIIYFESLKKEIADFIDTNRAYISDQAEVTASYAKLIRSGIDVNEVQKDMNRALDLAALKNISLSDAITLVDNAEHGRVKGLVDLGITSAKYVDSAGNVIDANHNMAKVMAELDAKTAHGRDTMTSTSQATNKLSNDWQDIAKIAGPPLINVIDGIAGGVDWALRSLKALGEDKTWNTNVANALGVWQNIVIVIFQYIESIIEGFKELGKLAGQYTGGAVGGNGTPQRRAGGGSVDPGGAYIVGENGPEMLLMGSQGGNVIPNGRIPATAGGGGSYHVHVHVDRGAFIDGPSIDRLANLILLRARHAPGR